MCPTANHRNIFREIVVSGVAICMEIATESFQKFLGMGSTSAGLVLIHDNGPVSVTTGQVELHIALALGLFVRLMEYLEGGFVCMEDFSEGKNLANTC